MTAAFRVSKERLYPQILSKQSGAHVFAIDNDVHKLGNCVHRGEEVALKLVNECTDVPVPEVFFSSFAEVEGRIIMDLVPGKTLPDVWNELDGTTKERIFQDLWDMIKKFRQIPKPNDLQYSSQCLADGSPAIDPLLRDLYQPRAPLYTDDQLRTRIYDRYDDHAGRRYP